MDQNSVIVKNILQGTLSSKAQFMIWIIVYHNTLSYSSCLWNGKKIVNLTALCMMTVFIIIFFTERRAWNEQVNKFHAGIKKTKQLLD